VSNQHPDNLDHWVNRLSKQDMPIFARTAEHVTNVVARDISSVAELSRGILQDASMTARLLRMANSAYYNPHSHSINTITRAVMVLGFETVRSMCLSFTLIETLLKGAQRERAYQEMARCFHAAVQAKRLAAQVHDESPEEIFIAALLYRLGHIAFWCFGGELADRLEEAMLKPGYTQTLAEREVLGFRLEELTARLSEEWHLSKLLRTALESPGGAESRVSHIVFGHKLASNAERGWDSVEVKRLLGQLSERLKISPEVVTKLVHSSVKEAAETVEHYGGARKFRRLIPLPLETTVPEAAPIPPESPFPEPDRLLQFKILHELSSLLLNKQLDINLLFSILLEGIFRGVGMDRVLFALLTPDRRQLRGKFGLGWNNQDLMKEFVIETVPTGANIFNYSLEKRQPLWVTADPPAEVARLLSPQVIRLLGRSPFFLMAIAVKDRPIGVIYADRQPSGRELDEESFTSFRYFCQQADINLSYVAQ
jgi:HD-like signal output (HDOD) protein